MRLLAVLSALVVMACSKTEPEPQKSAPPAASVAPVVTAASARPAADPDDIGWEAPSAWVSVPNANAMRKATYKVPRSGGDTEDAELTISAAMGGADANIKRWAGQFGNVEPKTEPRTVNGLKMTVVEIKGTFASGGGMMGGPTTPKERYMLLGAVVETGERQHFFKLTGPEKTVTAARKDFDAFVSSVRAK